MIKPAKMMLIAATLHCAVGAKWREWDLDTQCTVKPNEHLRNKLRDAGIVVTTTFPTGVKTVREWLNDLYYDQSKEYNILKHVLSGVAQPILEEYLNNHNKSIGRRPGYIKDDWYKKSDRFNQFARKFFKDMILALLNAKSRQSSRIMLGDLGMIWGRIEEQISGLPILQQDEQIDASSKSDSLPSLGYEIGVDWADLPSDTSEMDFDATEPPPKEPETGDGDQTSGSSNGKTRSTESQLSVKPKSGFSAEVPEFKPRTSRLDAFANEFKPTNSQYQHGVVGSTCNTNKPVGSHTEARKLNANAKEYLTLAERQAIWTSRYGYWEEMPEDLSL